MKFILGLLFCVVFSGTAVAAPMHYTGDISGSISIIDQLHKRGIAVKFLDDGISTEGSMGKMVVTILAAVAQAERERILERTHEGRRTAISNGVKMGRKPSISKKTKEQIKQQVSEGIPKAKIAATFKISRQSVYDIISEQ